MRNIPHSELHASASEVDELTEDSLLPLLKTKQLGRKIYAFGVCDSTNQSALHLLQSDNSDEAVPHGTLFMANHQRAGKGRNGKSWHSPAGLALAFTLVLESSTGINPQQLTMAVPLAVLRTLTHLGFGNCLIKWPNDVVDDKGKKICGVLIEKCQRPNGSEIFLTGIGININQNQSDFPEELREKATSLRIISGHRIDRSPVLAIVLEELEFALQEESIETTVQAWKQYCSTLNKKVRVRLSDGDLLGRAVGLGNDGRLIIQDETGALRRISAGDVEELRTHD